MQVIEENYTGEEAVILKAKKKQTRGYLYFYIYIKRNMAENAKIIQLQQKNRNKKSPAGISEPGLVF